ncbi:hypothetical protein FOCC_FOCC015919 [Frankliniella occidentalis]|nr:hypothetical protein FOCC_FOCC015919 [Frankliniella occidentalis]
MIRSSSCCARRTTRSPCCISTTTRSPPSKPGSASSSSPAATAPSPTSSTTPSTSCSTPTTWCPPWAPSTPSTSGGRSTLPRHSWWRMRSSPSGASGAAGRARAGTNSTLSATTDIRSSLPRRPAVPKPSMHPGPDRGPSAARPAPPVGVGVIRTPMCFVVCCFIILLTVFEETPWNECLCLSECVYGMFSRTYN